eukprot:5340125-Pyramimonas_sp.AAC.1
MFRFGLIGGLSGSAMYDREPVPNSTAFECARPHMCSGAGSVCLTRCTGTRSRCNRIATPQLEVNIFPLTSSASTA